MCNAVLYTSAVADMPIGAGVAKCRAVSCRAGYSFMTPHVPKQCNGHDCGMHVLGEYTVNNTATAACSVTNPADAQVDLSALRLCYD